MIQQAPLRASACHGRASTRRCARWTSLAITDVTLLCQLTIKSHSLGQFLIRRNRRSAVPIRPYHCNSKLYPTRLGAGVVWQGNCDYRQCEVGSVEPTRRWARNHAGGGLATGSKSTSQSVSSVVFSLDQQRSSYE